MIDTQRINLLPDIKQERLQQQRREQYTRLAALAVIVGMAAIALIIGGAAVYQWQSLVGTQEDIEEERANIAAIENRQQLVGMQTALEELPALSAQKLLVTELPAIMEQVVPQGTTITVLEYQAGGAVEIAGETGSFRDLYEFVDALETVEGTVEMNGQEQESARFFRQVVLTGGSPGEEVAFTLEAELDEAFLSPSQFTGADNE